MINDEQQVSGQAAEELEHVHTDGLEINPTEAPGTQPETDAVRRELYELEVRALLAQKITDAAAVYAPEFQDALAHAKVHLPAEYALFKENAKGKKISTRDLEKAVTHRVKKSRRDADEPTIDLGRTDLNGAVAPRGWTVSLDHGVRKVVSTREGEQEILACPDGPVLITARLENVDNGMERLELSFFKDGTWKKLIGARTQVYNRAGVIAFGDHGLHVTSETARNLVQYLSEYETKNKKRIPLRKSIARVGWIADAEFFPYATDEEIAFTLPSSSAALSSMMGRVSS
ncbi:MAG: DUF927 domain-containing protein [Firmicutes bacterium]|nr:DUF927 domain-containing protein [Bacillota bacterium]